MDRAKLIILVALSVCGLSAQIPMPSPVVNGTGGGGGGGTCPGGSDTQVQFKDGSTDCGGSSKLTFNKTTGQLSVEGGVAAGTSPPSITAGTAGLYGMKKGTAPTGAADTAIIYAAPDAATLLVNLNNAGPKTVCTTAGESGCGGTLTLPINAQTGTTYTILAGDQNKFITANNSSAQAYTLPAAGGSFPDGWCTVVKTIGSGTMTLTPASGTINASASQAVSTGEGGWVCSDGSNWRTAFLHITGTGGIAVSPGAGGPLLTASNVPLTSAVTGILPLANGGTNCAAPYVTNPQTSTYQVLAADFTCFKTISVASGTFTITLVASGSQPVAGTWIRILNYGSGVVTVARSGQNINGGTSSLTLPAASATAPTGAVISSDGTNYFAQLQGVGGSGCVPSGSVNQVLVDHGSGGTCDSSTVTITSGVLNAPNGLTAGASPPSVTSGTGGLWAGPEGTAPSVCAVSAVDCLYFDSTQHGLLASFNNGSYLPLIQGPASSTANHVPTFNASNGGLLKDSGLTLTASTGTFTLTNGKTLSVSNTLTFTGTDSSSVAFGGGGTVTYTIASGTSALGTSAISSGACATVVTTSATGTATTDDIIADFNADPTSTTGYSASANGMLTIIKYPTTNNVNFKVCNNTASSITPGAVTLNWRVVR